MKKRLGAIVLLSSLLISLSSTSVNAEELQIIKIYDGDTLTLASGEKVRFLQIDAPELASGECYGSESLQILKKLIGNSTITLESDPVSTDKDRFGRLLRYVNVGNLNINLKMVELGAATPYFFEGEKGKYSQILLKAAQAAQKNKVGLWKACPSTKLNPYKPATTGKSIRSPK